MLTSLKEDLEGQLECLEEQIEELDQKLSNVKLFPEYPGNGEQSQRDDETSRQSTNQGFAKKFRKSKVAKVLFDAHDNKEESKDLKKKRVQTAVVRGDNHKEAKKPRVTKEPELLQIDELEQEKLFEQERQEVQDDKTLSIGVNSPTQSPLDNA